MYVYNFPATIFVPKDFTGQVDETEHVVEEANEAMRAVWESPARHVSELLDCIHACETALRSYDKGLVDTCCERVHDKNSLRGYYGGPRVLMGREDG